MTLLDPPPLTILTGGGSWFGRAFLAALASGDGETAPDVRAGEVRVLVASPADVDLVLEVLPAAEVRMGDIADMTQVTQLFADAENASVVHAAGVVHADRVADFERVNAGGTANVLNAARRARARRLVYLSSGAAFGANHLSSDVFGDDGPFHPALAFGRSMMHAEQRVRDAHDSRGLQTVVVRPPWLYGPWLPDHEARFLRLIRAGRFPLLGRGSQRRSMVYVDNLVQGVLLAERVAEAAGEAFWVADPRPYPMSEILTTVRQAFTEEGLTISRRQVRLPRVAGRMAGRADRILQARGIYQQRVHVLGELDTSVACDISNAQQLLGYAPQVGLLEGMRRAIRWCVDNGIDL